MKGIDCKICGKEFGPECAKTCVQSIMPSQPRMARPTTFRARECRHRRLKFVVYTWDDTEDNAYFLYECENRNCKFQVKIPSDAIWPTVKGEGQPNTYGTIARKSRFMNDD